MRVTSESKSFTTSTRKKFFPVLCWTQGPWLPSCVSFYSFIVLQKNSWMEETNESFLQRYHQQFAYYWVQSVRKKSLNSKMKSKLDVCEDQSQ